MKTIQPYLHTIYEEILRYGTANYLDTHFNLLLICVILYFNDKYMTIVVVDIIMGFQLVSRVVYTLDFTDGSASPTLTLPSWVDGSCEVEPQR